MMKLRKRLSWFAGVWLFCQIAGFAAAPLTFGAHVIAAAIDGCDCPGTAPGQVCPMHAANKAQDDNTCRLRNACAPDEAALLSIVGGTSVTPDVAIASIDLQSISIDSFVTIPLVRAELPDSPPPRA